MNSKKFLAVWAAMGLVFFAIASGGCGGSSSHSASNEDQFIDAVSYVVDDIQSIADSAMSNGTVVNAISDIISQYLVTSITDGTLMNRVIGRSVIEDIEIEDFTSPVAASFDKGVYVRLWEGKHITVENNVVTSFENNHSDFQLTINSGDHVTKLTLTPISTSGYWKAYTGLSTIINELLTEQFNAISIGEHNYLVFLYVLSSARLEITYNDTKLLDGTFSLTYPNNTPDSKTNPIYENTPHTSDFKFTFYPQDNKDYTVGFDFIRNVASSGSNSLSNTSDLKLYRKAGTTTRTILNANAGLDITIPLGSTSASASRLTALDLNIADRIRITESSSLDLLSLLGLYITGTNTSLETLSSNVARINTLLENAGLSIYLNQNTTKAGDIRALVGKFGDYDHARLGIQFVDASGPELVNDIVNPDDLQQLRTLVGSVSGYAQVLARMLTNIQDTGILGGLNITGNGIITLIFNDLFGAN